MTNSVDQQAKEVATIHPATTLGAVHYTVASLERQITFYQQILGFQVHWRNGASVGLGVGGRRRTISCCCDTPRRRAGTACSSIPPMAVGQ